MHQQNNQQLNEGLRPLDLKEMIHPTFKVDTYRSKMGEDKDICVLTFEVKDRQPAKDLMEFLEKGYAYVLDADVSSGENEEGEYFVFVELPRSSRLAEHIREITYGVHKLTGIEDFKFKYYKDDREHEVSEETLRNIIPESASTYENMMNQVRTEEVKRFFTKTLMDDFTLDGDVITIHKPFNQKIQLKMVKEGAVDSILEGVTDPITMDQESMSEIFWLTKVLGDYNINKVGDSFMFDNKGQAILLQRIQ
jgi:hypothetical protein